MIKNNGNRFSLEDRVCVITGGAGLIGKKHASAVIEGGGIAVLLDISSQFVNDAKKQLISQYPLAKIETFIVDITRKEDVELVSEKLIRKYGHIDALINNAANNPKVEGGSKNLGATKFVDFPVEVWNEDIMVGLTGAMVCSQVFGKQMEMQGKGVVINIGSDYGIIAPDQRIYRRDGIPEDEQIIKPISYSVVKHGIIGLTKYLAAYWGKKGIRVNTLCPASLYNGQDDDFVKKLSELVPMGRMSDPDEYIGTVQYMLSDASSYMTGATVVLDGGRTII